MTAQQQEDCGYFLTQLEDHESLMERFIEKHIDIGAYLPPVEHTSSRARICWRFGIVLNLARTLTVPVMVWRNRYLEHVLRGWPDELRQVLLLVAAGHMRLEQAALLPALPLVSVRSRICRCTPSGRFGAYC